MAELSSESSENYLKHIYRLSLDHEKVKTSHLAAALSLSPAAVTEMLKRLDEQRLVSYRPYQGVLLTDAGRKRALLVIRRHRLWEVFLHRVLGVPWGEVHEHAERLEHATDARLATFLDDYLGQPEFDPHGHPIPSSDGVIQEVERLRLPSLEPGTRATIVQCTNEQPELLDYLKSLDLTPGSDIHVVAHAPFGGPITVRVGEREQAIGIEAARTLLVCQTS